MYDNGELYVPMCVRWFGSIVKLCIEIIQVQRYYLLKMSRESDIVYRNTSDFAGVQLKVTMLITAQIARQWFGETVSLSSRSDMWMSESFATYFSYSAHNEVV